MKYTHYQLVRFVILDLIAEYRAFPSDEVRDQIAKFYKHRHICRLDAYGWPYVPKGD